MPEGLPDINLLPKYERQSQSMFYLFIIFVMLIILAFVFIGVYYFMTKNKLDAAEIEHEQLSAQAKELQVQIDEIEADGNSSYAQAVTFAESHDLPTSKLITELDKLLPDHGYLSEYEYGSQVAKIITHFETLDTVAAYTTKLTISDYMKDVRVDKIDTFERKNEQLADNEVNFEIIPRYEAHFTLDINKYELKEESEEDE